MHERIKELRRVLGLTQAEFADKLGLKRNTIATYEIGRNDPIQSVITLICREFNVNESWLRTGEGDMFRKDCDSTLSQLAEENDLSPEDVVLVEKFLKLNKNQRNAVTSFVKELVVAFSELEEEEKTESATVKSLESDYQKTLHSASRTASSASSITGGTAPSSDQERKTGEAG